MDTPVSQLYSRSMEDSGYHRKMGPSSLSVKSSNDTSTMDIEKECLDDPNLDDEVENHLPKVLTMSVRLLLSSVLIYQKRRDGDWRYASLEHMTSRLSKKFAIEGGKVFLETYPCHTCL
ncbi:hypothetical protein Adt_18644 [Abeliophyllum distichum]|uniref:Uncharacterized protein n=1 Tax=Abeliophyllum distichum TaxID=126358 RepID=A0ABD1TJY1_9LAMI